MERLADVGQAGGASDWWWHSVMKGLTGGGSG